MGLFVSQGPNRRQVTLTMGGDLKGTVSKDVGLRNKHSVVQLSGGRARVGSLYHSWA